MWKYLLAWLPMIPIAVVNGALRDLWYAPRLGELPAHQVSTVTAILLLGMYMWAVLRAWTPASPARALQIGALWLGLTLAFEFLFGRVVAGNSWDRLLRDYDVCAGRVWIAIPLWVMIAPWLFHRLRRGRS